MSTITTLRGIIVEWGIRVFGVDEMKSVYKRALRFTEESIELAQALQVPREKMHQLVDIVYDRPIGTHIEEVGDVMTTFIALCCSAGIDPELAAELRVRDLLGQPIDKFQRRLKEKQEAGL